MDVLVKPRSDDRETSDPVQRDALTRLLRAAARVSAWQSRHLRGTGLSPSAFAVLTELAVTDDGGLQPCTLAERLGVTRPSVCGLIDGLEAKGLVERSPHARDGRRVVVSLTGDGEAVLRTHGRGYAAAQSALLADLSRSEQRTLSELLDRVAA